MSTNEVLMLSAAAMGIGAGFARHTLGLLLPTMTTNFIGSYERAGWLGTTNLGSYLVGMVLVSFVGGRFDPLVLIRWGLIGTVASLVVMAVAPNFALLVMGMVLAGFFAAGLWIPITSVVSGVTTVRERGRSLGMVVAGVGFSIIVAGQLVNLLRFLFGPGTWRQVWAVEALLGFIVLALCLVRLRPDLDPPAAGAAPIQASVLLRVPRWWAVTTAYAAYGFGYSLYLNYLTAALEDDAGFSATHAAIVYSLIGVTNIFGGIVFGRWSDRAGRRFALGFGLGLTLACILAIPLGAEPWVALSAAVFGGAMSGIGTVTSAIVSDHLPARAVGTAFGLVTVVFGITQATAPYAGGWIGDAAGSFTPAFIVAAGAIALGFCAALFVPSGSRSPAVISSVDGART